MRLAGIAAGDGTETPRPGAQCRRGKSQKRRRNIAPQASSGLGELLQDGPDALSLHCFQPDAAWTCAPGHLKITFPATLTANDLILRRQVDCFILHLVLMGHNVSQPLLRTSCHHADFAL